MKWVQTAITALLAGITAAGVVWAGGAGSERLDHHVEDAGIHMSAPQHRELGGMVARLESVVRRLERLEREGG